MRVNNLVAGSIHPIPILILTSQSTNEIMREVSKSRLPILFRLHEYYLVRGGRVLPDNLPLQVVYDILYEN